MSLQQCAGHETLTAILTLVRSLSRVIPQMQHQRRSLRKVPIALWTDVWPLARVRTLVDAQALLAGERLVARVALEDLLARVATLMRHQPPHGGQHRAAEITEVLRRCLVHEAVLILHVPVQQPLVDEFLRAELAHVLGPRVPHDRIAGLQTSVVRHQVHR